MRPAWHCPISAAGTSTLWGAAGLPLRRASRSNGETTGGLRSELAGQRTGHQSIRGAEYHKHNAPRSHFPLLDRLGKRTESDVTLVCFLRTGRTDVFNTTQKRFPSGPRVIEETHFSPNTALYHFMFRNSFHRLQRSMKADILQKTRAVKSGTRTPPLPPRPVSHLSDRNRTKAYSGRRCFGGKDDGRLKVTTKEREKLRMTEWMKGILGNGVHG